MPFVSVTENGKLTDSLTRRQRSLGREGLNAAVLSRINSTGPAAVLGIVEHSSAVQHCLLMGPSGAWCVLIQHPASRRLSLQLLLLVLSS